MRHAIVLPLLLCSLLGAASLSAAQSDQVYRYTDKNGVVHYTDAPPSKNAKPVNLPKIQTFRSGEMPKSFDVSGSKKPTAPKFSVAFDSPSPEQTFREVQPTVSVSVSVMPGLVGGHGLMYSVDGQPINDAPSFSTRLTIPGLERGTHVISVALVDAKRQVLAQSSVNVHMKPPIARQ